MASYLVETYLARGHEAERAAYERRARAAAETSRHEKAHVRFDRSIYVPADEICFYVFDAPSARHAARAAAGAGLDAIRVTEAIASPKEEK